MYSGYVQSHLYVIDSLYSTDIIDVHLPEADCMLDNITWKRKEKLPFLYSYQHKLKIPLFYSEQDFCKPDYRTPQLRLWMLENSRKKMTETGEIVDRCFLYGEQYPLYYMRPETSPIEKVDGVFKLVSNVQTIDLKNRKFMVEIMGKDYNTIIYDAHFNSNKQLHGIMSITIKDDTSHTTELPWNVNRTLTAIKGRFHNGVLQGIVSLYFTRGQMMYATIKDGYLHGGLISHGTSPVLPGVVSNHVSPQSENANFFFCF